jgi:hypothetical protein
MRQAIECGSKKCPWCHVTTHDEQGRLDRVTDKIRPLSPDDLRWWFREAESRLGLRSTFGAFVDLAMSGIQGGGRTNGAERSWTEGKRHAAARERCIRWRLHGVSPQVLAVLDAAYGPHALADRAERVTGLADARRDLSAAFGDLLAVALLTDAASPLFEARRSPQPPPSETRRRVRAGGVVREEARKEFVDGAGSVVVERPQAAMEYDTVHRIDGPVERIDAVETDASFLLRVQGGETSAERHEVHIRRWRGHGDGMGVLARLAELVRSALRAKAKGDRDREHPSNPQEVADLAHHRTVEAMIQQAVSLRERAHDEAGIQEETLTKTPRRERRRSVQRSRKVRSARAS